MNVVVTVDAPNIEAVVQLCASQGWAARQSRNWLPDDPLLRGLLLLFGFLFLIAILYVVANALVGVSETLFGVIAGSGAQGSTIQQGANAYRDTRQAYAAANYAPPPPNPRVP